MNARTVIFIWIMLTVFVSCQEGAEEYLKAHKNDILRAEAESASLPADGESALLISAYIPAPADLKTVDFTTTNGTFRFSDSNSYSVDATPFRDSLRAQAHIIASTETTDEVLIKVKASTVDTVLTIHFIAALADSIANESATASIKRGYNSEVPVKTMLFRKTGVPSQHQTVTFLAFASDKKNIGEFRDISPKGSDSNGVVNSVFVLKDTLYTGPIKIISQYHGTRTYTDTLQIFVTKK